MPGVIAAAVLALALAGAATDDPGYSFARALALAGPWPGTALAAVRRVRRLGRTGNLRVALALDEVGRGHVMHLRSPAPAPRAAVEGAILRAARGGGLRVRRLVERLLAGA